MKASTTKTVHIELSWDDAERLLYVLYEARTAAEREKAPSLGQNDRDLAVRLYDEVNRELRKDLPT